MTRVEFTGRVVKLLGRMVEEGESPVIDFVKRSDEEQRRLFEMGLSKCDGFNQVSRHQTGRAMDIYFVEGGRLCEPRKGLGYWHGYWQTLGGAKMIEWDRNHFE